MKKNIQVDKGIDSNSHLFLVDGGVRGESDALVAELRVVHPAVRVAVVREVVLQRGGRGLSNVTNITSIKSCLT